MPRKTKLKIGCPKCGSHVTTENGLWRCLNPKCRYLIGQQNPLSWQGHSPDPEDMDEYAGCYTYYKGRWSKVAGTEKSLDKIIKD